MMKKVISDATPGRGIVQATVADKFAGKVIVKGYVHASDAEPRYFMDGNLSNGAEFDVEANKLYVVTILATFAGANTVTVVCQVGTQTRTIVLAGDGVGPDGKPALDLEAAVFQIIAANQ